MRALLVALALMTSGRPWLYDEPFGARRAPRRGLEMVPAPFTNACDRRTCESFQTTVSSGAGDPGLVSVREVADQLGVHPETIRRLIHDGRLDAVRVGRVLRVHREAVDRFLARQRVKPTRFQA